MAGPTRIESNSVPTEVDVCVPSLHQLSREFREHLRSRVPVHCLLISSKVGIGKARQELIEKVDTEWFVFVDDDVRLRPNWWEELSSMTTSRAGGIEGLWSYALTDQSVDDYARSMERMARLLGRSTWIERVERAFTGDTLIRTDAVKRIQIPDISVYEDEFIRRYVKRNGFEWLRSRVVVCDHLRTYNLEKAYESGKYAYYFGQTSPVRQIQRLAQLPFRLAFSFFYTRNARAGLFALRREVRVLRGVLHAYVQTTGFPHRSRLRDAY